MVRILRMGSCLVAAAVAVSPPAVVPPPATPATLPAVAVAAQMQAGNVGMVAAPAANVASNAQLAPRIAGQPLMMAAQAATANAESSLMATLQNTPANGAYGALNEAQFGHQEVLQPSYSPTASVTEWASSLGAILLAAVAGAVVGAGAVASASWWRQRAQAASGNMAAAGVALTLMAGVAGPGPALAADLENGETVFQANCASCHAGGNNSIVPEKKIKKAELEKYLTGGYKVESIITQVTNGKNSMPAFGDKLGPDDIEDVANYVYGQADKW